MITIKAIQSKRDAYLEIIETAIKQEIDKIFKNHTNLVEFNDIMGSAWFVDKHGNKIDLIAQKMNSSYEYYYEATYKYFSRLLDLYAIESGFCIGETIKNI